MSSTCSHSSPTKEWSSFRSKSKSISSSPCSATSPRSLGKPNISRLAKRSLRAASGDRLEALYVLAVTAGLRTGELLGPKWEDLDPETGVLRVRRTRSQARTGPSFTTPKNGKGRSMRLTRQAVEALGVHKAAQYT